MPHKTPGVGLFVPDLGCARWTADLRDEDCGQPFDPLSSRFTTLSSRRTVKTTPWMCYL